MHREEHKSKSTSIPDKESIVDNAQNSNFVSPLNTQDSFINYAVTSVKVKSTNQVLLATAPVIIYDKLGKVHRCRTFLDAG